MKNNILILPLAIFPFLGFSQVGVGTTTPQSELDVEGNLAVGASYSGTTAAPTNGAIIEGTVGIGTSGPLSKLDVEGNLAIGAGYSGSTAAPSNGAIIQGHVGMGTNAPAKPFHLKTGIGYPMRVEGTASRVGMQFINTATSIDHKTLISVDNYDGSGTSNMGYFSFNDEGYQSGVPTNGGNLGNQISFVNKRPSSSFGWYKGIETVEGNAIMRLNYTGSLHIKNVLYSTSAALSSDKRLKKDILPLENGYNVLKKIKPVSYMKKQSLFDDFSSETTKFEYGFIAQDIQKILPHIVHKNQLSGALAIEYHSFIPILVKAMQEQEEENKALKKQIKSLSERLEALEK